MSFDDQTIQWLFQKQLKIDDEWSVRIERGFTWWAHENAQHVEVIGVEETVSGEPDYLVSVRTEVADDVELTPQVVTSLNSMIMPISAMAGVTHDARTGKLYLSSLVRIHDQIRGWMNPIIGAAAAMQVCEARAMWPQIAERLGGRFASSGHPVNGLRPAPDDILGVGPLIDRVGQEPCRWQQDEFEDALARHMQRPPSLGASCGGQGVTVELPYGRASSLCELSGDDAHPVWGAGLSILQRFPVGPMSDLDGAILALALNAEELTRQPTGYGFGSFFYEPGESPNMSDGTINFTGFLPNILHRPGLIANLYYACASRAVAMEQRLLSASEREDAARAGPESAVSRLRRLFPS
jgi:hypothetical protein